MDPFLAPVIAIVLGLAFPLGLVIAYLISERRREKEQKDHQDEPRGREH